MNKIIKKLFNIRYNIIIFIVEAICMILELVASRILSPYFGNSNIIWTSIIGIILLSSSIGNYLGGKIADKNNIEKNLKFLLLLSATYILFIPFVEEYFLKTIVEFIHNIKLGAILSSILLFFIPSMFMGFIVPIILKLKLNSLENSGKISGNFYAISTLGGIIRNFFRRILAYTQFRKYFNIIYTISNFILISTYCWL